MILTSVRGFFRKPFVALRAIILQSPLTTAFTDHLLTPTGTFHNLERLGKSVPATKCFRQADPNKAPVFLKPTLLLSHKNREHLELTSTDKTSCSSLLKPLSCTKIVP